MTALISATSYNSGSRTFLYLEGSIALSSLTIAEFIVLLTSTLSSILSYLSLTNLHFQNQIRSKKSFLFREKFSSRKSVTQLLRDFPSPENNYTLSTTYNRTTKLIWSKTTEGFEIINQPESYSLPTVFIKNKGSEVNEKKNIFSFHTR